VNLVLQQLQQQGWIDTTVKNNRYPRPPCDVVKYIDYNQV